MTVRAIGPSWREVETERRQRRHLSGGRSKPVYAAQSRGNPDGYRDGRSRWRVGRVRQPVPLVCTLICLRRIGFLILN